MQATTTSQENRRSDETRCDDAIELVSGIAKRYHLSALDPLLASARAVAAQSEISIAIVGRFKAGKSSFLNHFLNRQLLPVGVVPVTALITEISYGEAQRARVTFLDGRSEEVSLEAIRQFVTESENPENVKGAARLEIELPTPARFRRLRFVDTPGLESALQHNTQTARDWLPHIGCALVAISIDQPLSQTDIALLRDLQHYTPRIAILLTKVDLLDNVERDEVIAFMQAQLARSFDSAPPIFSYSVRAGFEDLRAQLEEDLIARLLNELQTERAAIINRKLETLLQECRHHLALALKAAELNEAEREALRREFISEKELIDEVKFEMRLIARDAASRTRAHIAERLKKYQAELEARLRAELKLEFPQWTKSLDFMLASFEKWLRRALVVEMKAIEQAEREHFIAPLAQVKRHLFRALQNFRDHIAERVRRAYGVSLQTSETEITVAEPRAPDVRTGRIFDRNWELLSPLAPVWLIKSVVENHFKDRLPYMIEKNLSRLASQWAESVNGAIEQAAREAERRADELIATIERLIASRQEDAPRIRFDLERLESVAARHEDAGGGSRAP
jgi:GTP-binding protein EngB required for normal cell division